MKRFPGKITVRDLDIPVEAFIRPIRSRYRLSVSEKGVRLVIARSRLHEAEEILKRHGGWIAGHYEKIKKDMDMVPELCDGEGIPFRGGKCFLRISGGEGGVSYDGVNSVLQIYAAGNEMENIRGRLCLWYFAQSANFARELCRRWKVTEKFGVGKVVLRDMRTRWGTCSCGRKTIILNWRLIMAPDEIFEYVLIHELAHLKVPGHGRGFWRHMEELLPGAVHKKGWLNRNGNSILRFMPGSKLSGERIV